MHTTSINNVIYSVDMIIAYINIMKPEITEINVKDYKSSLEYKGWGKIDTKMNAKNNDSSKDKKEKDLYKLPPILLKKKKKKIKRVSKDTGKYSAIDVLENKDKYKKDYELIKDAKLHYPVIIYKSRIVDGVHRLAKAHMKKVKKLKAIKLNDQIMKTFILDKKGNYQNALSTNLHTLITMFYDSHIKPFAPVQLPISNKYKYGLITKKIYAQHALKIYKKHKSKY